MLTAFSFRPNGRPSYPVILPVYLQYINISPPHHPISFLLPLDASWPLPLPVSSPLALPFCSQDASVSFFTSAIYYSSLRMFFSPFFASFFSFTTAVICVVFISLSISISNSTDCICFPIRFNFGSCFHCCICFPIRFGLCFHCCICFPIRFGLCFCYCICPTSAYYSTTASNSASASYSAFALRLRPNEVIVFHCLWQPRSRVNSRHNFSLSFPHVVWYWCRDFSRWS